MIPIVGLSGPLGIGGKPLTYLKLIIGYGLSISGLSMIPIVGLSGPWA